MNQPWKLLSFFFFMLTQMGAAQSTFLTIEGTPPADWQGTLSLEALIAPEGDWGEAQKLAIKQGGAIKWDIEFNEPGLYQLEVSGYEPQVLIVDKAEEIKLLFGENQDLSIAGSSGNVALVHFQRKLEDLQMQYFGTLKPKMEKAIAENDEAKVAELQEEVGRLFPKFVQSMQDAVDSMGVSASAYAAMDYIDANKGLSIWEYITNKFEHQAPGWALTQILRHKLNAIKGLKVGVPAPDFTLTSLTGESVHLAELKGNIVLVDFWASWCLGCRAENPLWEKLHQKYSDQGFVILGVGVQDELDRFSKAAAKDVLTYPQLNAINTGIPERYFVESLPQNVLINREGIILAKNLKAADVEKLLQELLN